MVSCVVNDQAVLFYPEMESWLMQPLRDRVHLDGNGKEGLHHIPKSAETGASTSDILVL